MSYSTKTWGGHGTEISGIVTTTDSSTALLDYAGNSNTTKIINQLGFGNNAPTAFYCMTRTMTVGGTTLYGYLGALGEWQTAYNNKSSIDSALSKIGGTAIATESSHWTSTQHSSTNAWCLTWGNGVVGGSTKDGSNYVRAFYPLS